MWIPVCGWVSASPPPCPPPSAQSPGIARWHPAGGALRLGWLHPSVLQWGWDSPSATTHIDGRRGITHIILNFMRVIDLRVFILHDTHYGRNLTGQQKSSRLPQQQPLPLNLRHTVRGETNTCSKGISIWQFFKNNFIYICVCVCVCHTRVQYLENKHQGWSGCQSKFGSLIRQLYKHSGSHFFFEILYKWNIKTLFSDNTQSDDALHIPGPQLFDNNEYFACIVS